MVGKRKKHLIKSRPWPTREQALEEVLRVLEKKAEEFLWRDDWEVGVKTEEETATERFRLQLRAL